MKNIRPLLPTNARKETKLVAGLDYPSTTAGSTKHVTVMYATSLGADGAYIANHCLLHVEDDYLHLKRLFGGIDAPNVNLILAPLSTTNDGSGGAYHYGCNGTDLYCDVQFMPNLNVWTSLALFVAEAVEVFEATQGLGWDCGASNGEGLSRVLAETIHPVVLDAYTTTAAWLDGQRQDWVTKTNPTDQDSQSNGCAVLFLTWMHTILGFTYTQISEAGSPTLAGTYQKLTGKNTAFADFTAAVNVRWPAGSPSGVTGDNPWFLEPG